MNKEIKLNSAIKRAPLQVLGFFQKSDDIVCEWQWWWWWRCYGSQTDDVGGWWCWRLAKELLDGLKESVVLAENEPKIQKKIQQRPIDWLIDCQCLTEFIASFIYFYCYYFFFSSLSLSLWSLGSSGIYVIADSFLWITVKFWWIAAS